MIRPVAVILLTLTLSAAVATAAEPDKPAAVASAIRLPNLPVQTPAPPAYVGPVKLSPEYFYIVDADIDCMILASPEGLVSVTKDEGPLRVRGKFVDGSGAVETRVYKGKYVFTIEAVKTGSCELLIIPAGATKPAEVIRRMLDVNVGPRPPPPEPEPEPLPDALMTPLRGAWSQETDAAKIAHKTSLAAVYRQAVAIVDNKQLATVGQLYAAIRQASAALLPDSALPQVRSTLADYLKANAPTTAAQPLDEATRNQLKAVLDTIARGLETLK